MIRASRLADYGVVLAGHMAGRPETFYNACDLAMVTQLPAPTVSKVLAALTRAGVLVSHRGARGGYRLARDPRLISAAEIVAALDGPIAMTVCIEHGEGACEVETSCPSRRGWMRINAAIRKALEDVSLADLAPFPAPPMTTACADDAAETHLAAPARGAPAAS
jgi:FeS assembly SUF system regulator